ncbi:MAG: hypothetical protein LBB29_00480 [Holosporaceae bacterium]|nr:hypothetical protein [Holosporaceae bacterium]
MRKYIVFAAVLLATSLNATDLRNEIELGGAIVGGKSLEEISAIIDKGADVNAKPYGRTAISWAISSESSPKEVFELLISEGAKVKVENYGDTIRPPFGEAIKSANNQNDSSIIDKVQE